jgi:hypothetical protein
VERFVCCESAVKEEQFVKLVRTGLKERLVCCGSAIQNEGFVKGECTVATGDSKGLSVSAIEKDLLSESVSLVKKDSLDERVSWQEERFETHVCTGLKEGFVKPECIG